MNPLTYRTQPTDEERIWCDQFAALMSRKPPQISLDELDSNEHIREVRCIRETGRFAESVVLTTVKVP